MFSYTTVCYECSNLEVLIDHLIDGDWAGGMEELVHVHLRVPLRGPVLLLQLYGRLQQGLGSVGPGLFGAAGSETQKISQLQIRFLYQQFPSSRVVDPDTIRSRILAESGSGPQIRNEFKV